MKKIVIVSMALVFAIGTLSAQEQGENKKNKDFSEILPKAGDIAIGLDMANFVKSINNSITNPYSARTVVAFQSDIFGKIFLTDNSALRVRLGIGINNFTEREFVRDDAEFMLDPLASNPILEKKVVDVWKSRNTGIELGIGYEYRRSLWRVQGYAGAEVFGGIVLDRNYFEYGNPMIETNQTPSTTWWGINGYSATHPFGPGNPVQTIPGGTGSYRGLDARTFGFTAGAALFIGADLFICRNLSIGAEFNFEGRYTQMGEQTMKTETWLLDQAYTADEKVKPITSSFGLLPMGRLNLMIYF
jgi:hypothetical protein